MFQATEQLREKLGCEVDEVIDKNGELLNMVLQRSEVLLIQMTSPDALIRLQRTQLASPSIFMDMYFEQHRGSIQEFICHHLNLYHLKMKEVCEDGGLLLHVSTEIIYCL